MRSNYEPLRLRRGPEKPIILNDMLRDGDFMSYAVYVDGWGTMWSDEFSANPDYFLSSQGSDYFKWAPLVFDLDRVRRMRVALVVRRYQRDNLVPVERKVFLDWKYEKVRMFYGFRILFPYPPSSLVIRRSGFDSNQVISWPLQVRDNKVTTRYTYVPPGRIPRLLLGNSVPTRIAVKHTKLKLPFRSRDQSRPNPESHYHTFTEVTDSSAGQYSINPVQVRDYYRSVISIRTPNFRFLRKKDLPVNNFTCRLRRTTDNGSRSVKSDYYFSNGASDWFGETKPVVPRWFGGFSDMSFDGVALNKAIQKCIDQSGSNMNNVAQDIAQFRQTTNLIGNTAIRLASALKATKSGKFQKAVNVLWGASKRQRPNVNKLKSSRDLASNWLELQYGWKPLLQDIDGSMKSLAAYVANDPIIKKVRASARVSNQGKFLPLGGPPAKDVYGYWSYDTYTDALVSFRYKLDNHLTAFLAQTGFTNPINLGWELLPYSFVVDWFIPIGPYLEAMSAFDGLVFVDGFKTQFARLDAAVVLRHNGDASWWASTSSIRKNWSLTGNWQETQVYVKREKLTSFPSLNPPVFKSPISVTHALNGLALLRTAFGRK